MSQIKSVLVDNRNVKEVLPGILDELANAKLWGLDCETTDIETRHDGLNAYCNATRLVFDHRRTTMTGMSTYVEGSDTAYYFNLAHADVANRLHPAIVKVIIEAVNPDAIGVAHNLPFELVMFKQCHDIDLNNFACTLQMAVSHHGPDQYDIGAFYRAHLPKAFHKVASEVIEKEWDGSDGKDQELLGKFIAKESKAEHSYNGFVKSIAMGYSLKALTKSAFGVEQTTFKEVLGDKTHMGQLTGDETVAYGADDAYWAVRHYRRMFDDMIKNNPKALKAFFAQENPMVYLYADSWREGIRLDLDQVFRRRDVERQSMAKLLREFKARIRAALPFPLEPHPDLLRKESWYSGKAGDAWQKKRQQIEAWAKSPDSDDDFTQVFQVSNPIGNAWAAEKGTKVPASGKLNIVYYHAMRTIMYDLLRAPMQYDEGSVASDKEARGRIREKLDGEMPSSAHEASELENAKQIMRDLQTMADIEQRVKLYLTPYSQLMDPETSRVYPSLSSQLATRRLAMSFPNAMQLARSGESAYIRSFYLGDADDHVVISADWSAIELVLIGDFAGGQGGFKPIYGQLPYGDMHSGSAVDCLSIKAMPGLTEAEFKEFKFGNNPNGRPLKDFSGRDLTPQDFHKWARGTAIGKGINFGYWYSGACSTVANNAGLTDTEHWELVDKYRERFPDEERWRVATQDEASMNGFITLPDGHQRNRFECTSAWRQAMMTKFSALSADPHLTYYAETAVKRIQARGRNQVVNAMIQGTCATLAKRSLLNLRKLCDAAGLVWGRDYRLMMPIHDELVFSVHKSAALAFIPLLRQAMGTHPDIVKHFPLDCTVAMGRTFRPFDESNPAMSQIELDEAQIIEGIVDKELKGSKLDDDKVAELLEYMFA